MPDYATVTNLTPTITSFGQGGVSDFIAHSPTYISAFFHSAGVQNLFNLLWAIVVILGATVAYIAYLTHNTEHHHRAHYKASVLKASNQKTAKKRSAAWHDVAKLMASEKQSDWKVAILEADSILDELLEDLGYVGENLGERLTAVPKGNMKNLEAAWSAHKVRNRIAHDTAAVTLDKREAIDTIGNLERVFREFDYI
ncbi:MAG TPA: hypothetical protein VJG48_03380 [Candidatus Paceibacterota bacterium]